MAINVYQCLRERIDEYALGFPETESGVEMQILQRLFTEEELYLQLSRSLEPVAVIAGRIGRSEIETATMLENMTLKGLTFPKISAGKKF